MEIEEDDLRDKAKSNEYIDLKAKQYSGHTQGDASVATTRCFSALS